MRTLVYEDDFLVGEKRCLVVSLYKVKQSADYPNGLEFTLQYLYFSKDQWNQIVRIDNQLHEGKPGTHTHAKNKVVWKDLTFDEAKNLIIKIGDKATSRRL